MTSRIFRSIVTVAAVILCCSLLIVMGVLYGYASDVQTTQLKDELSIAAAGTEQGGQQVNRLHRAGLCVGSCAHGGLQRLARRHC